MQISLPLEEIRDWLNIPIFFCDRLTKFAILFHGRLTKFEISFARLVVVIPDFFRSFHEICDYFHDCLMNFTFILLFYFFGRLWTLDIFIFIYFITFLWLINKMVLRDSARKKNNSNNNNNNSWKNHMSGKELKEGKILYSIYHYAGYSYYERDSRNPVRYFKPLYLLKI